VKANGVAGAVLGLAAWACAADPIDERMTVAEYRGGAGAAVVPADRADAGMLRPVGVTLVLAGIAGAMFFLLRRARGGRRVFGGRNVTVLETACLSPKHTLALVRIRNRILLIGMGQDVQTLAQFDRPDEVLGFDGAFSRELKDALDAPAEMPAEEPAPASAREPVTQLRKAVDRWRHLLRGEVRA
jgi:flagellar biogenesis protein FliO